VAALQRAIPAGLRNDAEIEKYQAIFTENISLVVGGMPATFLLRIHRPALRLLLFSR
jgi:hypothetical protein